ncbi:hypothetical protein HPB50_025358 [Hyalomma asiaticum]|uniref:Uncharacterized protein n=1 Tax=Hyalomma asiaticum TaxID=266040 RepID=A0ACB7RWP8_HYAAI|nr:hypothetical protein HPB50_025358 [Hyalomma asiaticum]
MEEITCSIRGCPNERGLSDPSHLLYVCTADDIRCVEWLAAIPKLSLSHGAFDRLCVCSLHFEPGVNVGADSLPTIFPPVPGFGVIKCEQQQQSDAQCDGQNLICLVGPATTIKQEPVEFEDNPLETETDFSEVQHVHSGPDALKAELADIEKGMELTADGHDISSQTVTGFDDDGATTAVPTGTCKPFTFRWILRPSLATSKKQKLVKLLTCSQCPFSTFNVRKMKKHACGPLGDELTCQVCLVTFPDAGSLKQHYSKHTGEKRYFCNLCPYRAATSNTLARHSRTHTGERRFSCGVCSYTCSRMDNLRRHMGGLHHYSSRRGRSKPTASSVPIYAPVGSKPVQ